MQSPRLRRRRKRPETWTTLCRPASSPPRRTPAPTSSLKARWTKALHPIGRAPSTRPSPPSSPLGAGRQAACFEGIPPSAVPLVPRGTLSPQPSICSTVRAAGLCPMPEWRDHCLGKPCALLFCHFSRDSILCPMLRSFDVRAPVL